MKWKPVGKMVLIKLHTKGSVLDLSGSDVQYNGLADVLGVGENVEQSILVGDTVMINGPQGIIAHSELGEHIALIPAALVLAKRANEVAN